MVTAGVYLVGAHARASTRTHPRRRRSSLRRRAHGFFAATIAVVQTDIKKVLAYSTISQLGFMFVALGVGAYGVRSSTS
jgi:NADH-quinone oxidoreductase subunit L